MVQKLIDFLRDTADRAITVSEDRTGAVSLEPPLASANLAFSTASETANRVEEALPGTSEIERILHLVPPPLDIEVFDIDAIKDSDRNFLPDPIAECAVHYPAMRLFDPKELLEAMSGEFRKSILAPSFHVVTPQGRTLYMTSAVPDECASLIAAWDFWNMEDKTADDLVAASRLFGQWLARRPEGFTIAELDLRKVKKQLALVRRIEAIGPESIGLACVVDDTAPMMDGRRVWHVLHSMGFKWGDMDCFQWADPRHQVDYLIWAECDDENYGYVLPEEIAAGRQNFRLVHFTLNPSRTPAPDHVLEQMMLAAKTFAEHLGCEIEATIDGEFVDGPDALRKAVYKLIAKYRALNLKPAMRSVLRLR